MDRGMHIENGMPSGVFFFGGCDVRLLLAVAEWTQPWEREASCDVLSQRLGHMTAAGEDPGSWALVAGA